MQLSRIIVVTMLGVFISCPVDDLTIGEHCDEREIKCPVEAK